MPRAEAIIENIISFSYIFRISSANCKEQDEK